MTKVQSYLFYEVLRAVLIIVGGLALLALLAQGLSRTDLILENRQSALTYFYIVMLGSPQIIALLMPLALFVAGVWSLNRIHKDSEIVVAQAAVFVDDECKYVSLGGVSEGDFHVRNLRLRRKLSIDARSATR